VECAVVLDESGLSEKGKPLIKPEAKELLERRGRVAGKLLAPKADSSPGRSSRLASSFRTYPFAPSLKSCRDHVSIVLLTDDEDFCGCNQARDSTGGLEPV